MKEIKACKYCLDPAPKHWPFQCFENPKRKKYKINPVGKVTLSYQKTRRAWFAANPPDANGFYWCYLNIARRCPNYLTPSETVLDHVKPKGSNPKLRHDLLNLMPSCQFCNSLKGSRSLEEALKLKQT